MQTFNFQSEKSNFLPLQEVAFYVTGEHYVNQYFTLEASSDDELYVEGEAVVLHPVKLTVDVEHGDCFYSYQPVYIWFDGRHNHSCDPEVRYLDDDGELCFFKELDEGECFKLQFPSISSCCYQAVRINRCTSIFEYAVLYATICISVSLPGRV